MKNRGKYVIVAVLLLVVLLSAVYFIRRSTQPDVDSADTRPSTAVTTIPVTEAQINLSDPNGLEEAFPDVASDNGCRTYYDIDVPTFCDSDGDGIGDLAGVIGKLDYIRELGFNAIALSSVMDSAGDFEVDPQYGAMYDLEDLVFECAQRGILVVVDFPLNGLDLMDVDVQMQVEPVVDFWLELGVKGFRLNQVDQLVADHEMANLDVLTWFNSYVKMRDPDACVLCRGQIPAEAFDTYYETGVDSLFNDSFAGSAGIITRAVSGELTGAAYAQALADYDQKNAVFFANAETGHAVDWFTGDHADAQLKMAHALSILLAGDVFVGSGEEQGLSDNSALWKTGSSEVCGFIKSAIALRNQYPEIALGSTARPEGYSDDQICLICRTYNDRGIVLIYNFSASAALVSLDGLTVQGIPAGDLNILGQLCAAGESVSRNGCDVTMPAYSILVLGIV